MLQITHGIDHLVLTNRALDWNKNEVCTPIEARQWYSQRRQSLVKALDCADINEDVFITPPDMGNRFYQWKWHMMEHAFYELSENLAQGDKLTINGKFWNEWRGKDGKFFDAITQQYQRATRIDYCFDVFDHPDSVASIWKNCIEPNYAGTKKTHSVVFGAKGVTIYLGSRKSAYFLRIYDKQAEQNSDHKWIRIELEMKKHVARQFQGNAHELAQKSALKIAKMCKSLPQDIMSYLTSLSVNYKEPKYYEPKAKSSAQIYIETFIKPYLRNCCADNPDVIDDLIQTLIDERDKQ